MPIEMIRNKGSDFKSDIWAFGVMFYYLIESKFILIQVNILSRATTKKTSSEISLKIKSSTLRCIKKLVTIYHTIIISNKDCLPKNLKMTS